MVAFTIWSLQIHRYGIFYLIAFVVGYFFLKYTAKTKLFSKRPNLQHVLGYQTEDIVSYAILGILIGGRLGHVLIYDPGYYLQHPGEILAIWKGGMSFIGGIVGTTCALLVFKKIKKLNRVDVMLLLDCLIVIVPFGIMLGRIGNFLNQELYGIIVPSGFRGMGYGWFSLLRELQIFHIYPAIDNSLRVNTNLLASFFEGLVLLIITVKIIRQRIKTKTYIPGKIIWIFAIWYSMVRFFLEYLRDDSQREFIWAFTKSQRFFIVFFFLWIYFIFIRKSSSKESLITKGETR